MLAPRGFTLIETIIYLALLSVVLVGVLTISYPLFVGAEHLADASLDQNEAAFILAKINAAVESSAEIPIEFDAPFLNWDGEPLNATRAPVKAFTLFDHASYIEVEFDIGTEHIGPVRFYKHL
ncbi:prepilin-type N-terminal cleavage/methylation domain-containing protein [Candidatus Parcubacteria bacterium]|nr:prepilin-type N-terminal cleavage/methylation domain-containing protein [Candidatus Parcubacteria bacterium]